MDRRPLVTMSLGAVAACAGLAQAQCVTYPDWGETVRADYTIQSTGKYSFFPNVSGGAYNFSVLYGYTGTVAPAAPLPQATPRRRVPMADPTILHIGDWYYVTGTTDASFNETNFAIYKSANLVDWFPHMLAFAEHYVSSGSSPSYKTGILNGPYLDTSGHTLKYGVGYPYNYFSGRMFQNMWAPQLYRDPTDHNKIYLAYTAVEGPDTTFDSSMPTQTPPHTCYVSWMDGISFLAGTGNFSDPTPYGYKVNNSSSSPVMRDGGFAQSLVNSPHTTRIPVSLDMSRYDPAHNGWGTAGCGNLYWTGTCNPSTGKCGAAFGHDCEGAVTGMGLDPFVYFESTGTSTWRRWMMYTWGDGGRYDPHTGTNDLLAWGGSHVAAFPMLDNTLMDAFGPQDSTWVDTNGTLDIPYAIAFHHHASWWPAVSLQCTACPIESWVENQASPPPQIATPPDCWILNGASGRDGQAGGCSTPLVQFQQGGVAEAPAAFNRDGRTYVLYSRNSFDSPAYGIFYRFSTESVSGDKLQSFADDQTTEYPLVMSVDRGTAGGWSYGHGEVFVGPTLVGQKPRYYLIYHAKEAETLPLTDTYSFPDGHSGRTVYLKELNFNPDGTIVPISNNRSARPSDTDGFIVPLWGSSTWGNPYTDPVMPPPDSTGGVGPDEP